MRKHLINGCISLKRSDHATKEPKHLRGIHATQYRPFAPRRATILIMQSTYWQTAYNLWSPNQTMEFMGFIDPFLWFIHLWLRTILGQLNLNFESWERRELSVDSRCLKLKLGGFFGRRLAWGVTRSYCSQLCEEVSRFVSLLCLWEHLNKLN